MAYLLDTNALIWWLSPMGNESPYQQNAVNFIQKAEGKIYASTINLVEIGIKQALGRFKIAEDVKDITRACNGNDFSILSLEPNHLESFFGLPLNHGDPFDRLLIAQAIAEDLTLISSDKVFTQYSGLKLHLLQK